MFRVFNQLDLWTHFSTSWISTHSVPKLSPEYSIFNIAFPWFSLIGAMIVFIVGTIVSALTGGYDISKTGTKLISPVAHWLVPREIREMELQEISAKPQEDENDDTHWTWSAPEETVEVEEEKKKFKDTC